MATRGGGRGHRTVPLVGRHVETQRLGAAWSRVRDGGRVAVLLVGEPGIGKTRLLEETAAQLAADGAQVLLCRCLGLAQPTPYQPVLDAIDADRMSAGERPEGLQAVAERVVPGRGGAPLLLAIDDLHWADRATVDLVLYLLAGARDHPVMVLASVRPEAAGESGPVSRLVADLRRVRAIEVVEVGPLRREDADELAAAVAPRPLSDAECAELWLRSEGNAFAHEQLAGAFDHDAPIPASLRDVVAARVDASGPPGAHLMRVLAVGVEPIPDPVLMEVCGLPPEVYVAALRDLAARRLVRVDELGVRSGHGLIREILRSAQLPAERRYLHERYATSLAHHGGPDARTAFHALAAGRPHDAVAGFAAAAEHAEDVDAYEDAWSHWQAAVAAAAEAAAAGVVQDQLVGRALHAAALAGEYAGGLAVLDARTAVAGLTAWSHQPRGELLGALGRGEEALAEFTLAEEAGADPERAVASAADTLVRLGRYDEALARARDALAGAPSLEVEVTAATALATAQVFLDDPGGREPLARTLEAAERRGDPVQSAVAALGLATLLTGPLNDVAAGIHLAAAAATAASAHGTARTYGVRLTAVAVEGLFRAGRWTEADTLLRRAFEQEPSGVDLVTLLLARARIGVARGHFAGSREDLDRVRLLLAGSTEGRFRIPTLTLLSGLAIWEGRFGEALEHALDALAPETTTEAWFVAPVLWHAHRAIAEARAAGRSLRVPGDVRERLAGVADGLQGTGRLRRGPVRDTIEAYAALWEAERRRHRPELAVAAWRDAGLRWERRGQPYPALYAGLHRAEAQLALDRRDVAGAELLADCAARARSMGAEPLAAVAAAIARRAGVRWDEGAEERQEAPVLASSPLALLTDRELGILRELTEGRRNREIATRLFISERTVTTHVSHILAKLQVHSRVQAAAVYHRARSEPPG